MKENRRIIRTLVVVSFLFLAMLSYLLYFNLFLAEDVRTKANLDYQWSGKNFLNRGKIYDSNGNLLAETVEVDAEIKRIYPYGKLFSHVVGYCSQQYDKSHVEDKFDPELVAGSSKDFFQRPDKKGNDINLTINADFQQYVYDLLGGKRGSVVAMNPKTGEILAMVSLPDFEPEMVGYVIENNEDDVLYSRATGLGFPPGSTFKIVTAVAAYENGMQDRIFNDTGGFDKNGLKIDNYRGKAYGNIGLADAFRVSSNQVFCEIGYELGPDIMRETAEKFGIDMPVEFDMSVKTSTIGYETLYKEDCALLGIGQGKLEMTPLHMLLICSSVANEGKMMKPYVVKSVSYNGDTVKSAVEEVMRTPMSEDCAEYIGELMTGVVRNGTGTGAQISGVTVAGKTGTAEAGGDKADHSWFVGYAPAENPQISVVVFLENDGGSGGGTAAPIAGKVMKKYLDTQNGSEK